MLVRWEWRLTSPRNLHAKDIWSSSQLNDAFSLSNEALDLTNLRKLLEAKSKACGENDHEQSWMECLTHVGLEKEIVLVRAEKR